MSPGQLGATVQDSKAKRQERLKSRFRDRGGIFVPAEGNALAQILLERGVNGESPMKQRSPRKSTAARSTPKSARTAKVATKTPRTASKRARKSTVIPGASLADEPKVAPATAKKNKRASTSKLKTPKSQGQRSQPPTEDVGVDGDDDADAAPPPASATPSRSHPAMRPKTFADRLADALNSTSGHFPPDPSRLAPSPTPQQGAREEGIEKGKGKTTRTRSASTTKSSAVARRQRENGDARQRAVQSTAVDPGHKPSSPGGRLAALGGPRADDSDDSDHSDLPLAQKLAKTAPTNARPKSRKKAGTKDARPPPARRKRTATKAKAKADTKLAADADMDEPTKLTAKSAVAGTSGTTAPEAAPGRKASAKSRKRGAEEQREREETAPSVAPPRGGEDVPDVALPPTKRARVLQEKNAPRKRKEPTKDVEDGSTAKNENENGPPAKKPRAATATSRSRRGKENENGIEPSKPARKAPKRAIDKPLLSPTGARGKTTSKAKPPLRSGGTRARSRGLPPDVLRRIKVNAQTLEALHDIDDDDPIDFLRS